MSLHSSINKQESTMQITLAMPTPISTRKRSAFDTCSEQQLNKEMREYENYHNPKELKEKIYQLL